MVQKIRKLEMMYFECEECKFIYKNKKIARDCEDYCKKHHACDLEITGHSIKI